MAAKARAKATRAKAAKVSGEGEGQSGDQAQSATSRAGILADRQQALREELRRQQGCLPGAGTPEGDAARDALDRAGDAMDNAEQALRNDDHGRCHRQSSPSDGSVARRFAIFGRGLGEKQGDQQQGQGEQQANRQGQSTDPLGRDQNGAVLIRMPRATSRTQMSIAARGICWLKSVAARRRASGPKPELGLPQAAARPVLRT